MRLYQLEDLLQNSLYAEISRVGTWSEGYLCKHCGLSTEENIEPLQIEFEPGSEVIGSFLWSGYTCVVIDAIRDFMEEHDFGCKFGTVEVLKPTTPLRKRKRVPFPYKGPKLHWLRPQAILSLDESRSEIRRQIDCPDCKQVLYEFKRSGLVLPKAEWNQEKIFFLKQYSKNKICYIVEPALKMLISAGFTNLGHREVGVIK